MRGTLNSVAGPAPAPAVIKLGGAAADDPQGAGGLWRAIAEAHARRPGGVVLVHGGGAAVDRHLARLGVVSQRRSGIRLTPPEQIDDVVAVLAGCVNKRLVGLLQLHGARAVGLSLGDGPTARTEPWSGDGFDAGRVGRVAGGDPRLLRLLLGAGYLPVLSSIGLDARGEPLNVNADDAAAGVARLLGADTLVFLTDVPGVLGGDGAPMAEIAAPEIEVLVAAGRIGGGMVAKVRSAAEAVSLAQCPVTIASWKDPAALRALLDGAAAGGAARGTRIVTGPAAAAAPPRRAEAPP